MNLRSHSAPIQVLLINRDSASSVPVVFSVPPTEFICPTPPSTPASLQRLPLSLCGHSTSTSSSSNWSQDSLCSDHQMALLEHNDILTPSCTPPDAQTGKDQDFFFSSFWLFWHYCLFFESPSGYLKILHFLRVRLHNL